MHHLLPLKVKIGIIVILAGGVAGVVNWVGFNRVTLSAVVGIVELIVIYGLLRSWHVLAKMPGMLRPGWLRIDLTGQWDGEIHSLWKPTQDSPLLDPILVSVELRQEWAEVVFRMKTEKMRSRSIGAVPHYDPITRELRFRYFYETEPTAAANELNPPQRLGSALAVVQLDCPDQMNIRYTNERSPGGDIELRRNAG
jgi:hypothetical protein